MQHNQDLDYLRFLSIFHYVAGGLACAIALFLLLYVGLGLILIFVPMGSTPEDECAIVFLGVFLVIIGAIAFILNLLRGVLSILTGNYLKRQTHYTFSIVIAYLECLWLPLGTILGVSTLVVLSKSNVKALYQKK